MSYKLETSETFLNRYSFFLVPLLVLGFFLLIIMATFKNINFASIEESGEAVQSSTYIEREKIFVGKHLTVVRAEIERENVNIPKYPDETLLLKGTILINQGVSGASYKWLLPEGVTVVDGQVEGPLNPYSVGQRQNVEIVVRGFDQTERKIITLLGEVKIHSQDYGGTAVISSRPDDSMEEFAPQMMKATRNDPGDL